MTHLLTVLSLVLALTLSGVCQERDAMLQFQLSDQLKQSATRWNNGDLEGFLQDYHQSPEMTFTSGGRILKGFEALEQRYRKSYGDQPGSMGHLTFSDFEAWRLGPEQALVLGRWTLKREQAGGTTDEGVFSLVMLKVGDRWKIFHDHTSASK